MRLGLIGQGAMGRLVYARALDEGHEVAATFTSADGALGADGLAERLRGLDAVVDFSAAEAVPVNAEACARAGVPLVEGTTGWGARADDVRRAFEGRGGALVYGANFSVGAQIFYRVVARAAELFERAEAYDAFVEEAHHARKRDAPSGTALELRRILAARLGREVSVASTRAGHIPGTHRVGFDSPFDHVTLTHAARSREGFAAGALLAARWIAGRRGVYEFSEVFEQVLGERADAR